MEERQRELREQLELRRQLEDQVETDDDPESGATEPSLDDVRFHVSEIRFSTSDILTSDELEAIARDLVGREITLAELQGMVDAINRAYRDRGFVTAQAILPPQDLTEGTVFVQLVEGRLGQYRLEGAEHTRDEYILRQLTTQPQDLVELPVLEHDLTRFNLLHDVALRAELVPGEEVGTTDVRILAAERQRHTIRVSADNTGNRTTGRERFGVAYRNASVMGFRDDLAVSITQSNGHTGATIGYGGPLGSSGTRGRLELAYDRTEINEGPVAVLGVTGSSWAWSGSLRHPIRVDRRVRLDTFAGFDIRTPKTILEGVLLQDARIRSVEVGMDGHRLDTHGYWIGSVSLSRATSQGLQAAQRDFTIFRGSLHRTQYLGDRYTLQVNARWQHARGDAAPSSEQFLIGGVGSVRGYETGQFGGDRGFTLSIELHHPIYSWGTTNDSDRVTGFFFADMGRTYPFRAPADPQPDRYNIRGIGWGLNARLYEDVTLRATIARGLSSYPETSRQHYLNFQLIWNAL